MNYDFSDKEFNLFVEIHTLIGEFAKESKIESSDASLTDENIRQALGILSQTPYLKLGVEQTEDYNGLLTLMGAMEVIAGISPSLFLSIEISTRIFGRTISNWGSDAQKENLLAPLLDGQLIGAVELSQNSMNVNNNPLQTIAVADGDNVKINGHKQYVINGPIADWFAVTGMMEGKNVICLLEKEAPGLNIGKKTSTMGYGGVAISGITLNNCTIPFTQVVFPKNDQEMLNTLRHWENQVIIGASLGLMKTTFESAKNYSKQHKTGGKPIIAYQEVGFNLSDMLTLFQTSQLFAYRTVWTEDAAPKEVESLTLCAKVFCTEAAEQVSAKAMNILGGSGFLSGNPVELAFRCSKYGLIAAPQRKYPGLRLAIPL